jgi:hypothetical protein
MSFDKHQWPSFDVTPGDKAASALLAPVNDYTGLPDVPAMTPEERADRISISAWISICQSKAPPCLTTTGRELVHAIVKELDDEMAAINALWDVKP